MKASIASLAFVAVLAFCCAAQAQSSQRNDLAIGNPVTNGVAAASPKVVAISGSVTGTSIVGLPVSGPCPHGFSNQCHSGSCQCDVFTGSGSVSRVGKGPATIYVTQEQGGNSEIESIDGLCWVAYLEFDITTPKDTETWGGVGSKCLGVDDKPSIFVGGLGLETSTVYSAATAQFSLPNFHGPTFKMTFNGKADL